MSPTIFAQLWQDSFEPLSAFKELRMDLPLLDPKIDVVFKMLFADEDSEPILIALLNAIIQGLHPITKAQVLNPQLPKRFIDDKGTILDIIAELDNGEQVNIEMQMANQGDTRSRALYHWARIYSSQLKRGKDKLYRSLKPVYSIFLLKFREFTELEPRLQHTLHIAHAQHPQIVLPDLKLHFVELVALFNSKYLNSLEEKKLALWAKFLLNPTDNQFQEEFMADQDITKAREKLQKLSANTEKRELARVREKAALDWNSSHANARQEGRQEGKVEGLAEKGLTVLKILLTGPEADLLSDTRIAEITGVKLEDVQQERKRLAAHKKQNDGE